LTFDAGYENGNVEKTLDVLKENNVSGAFFILSHIIDTNPELIKRMKNEGHLVCNHTATHKDMSQVDDFQSFKEEIETLENKYTELTGEKMESFFRPPEGKFNRRMLEFLEMLNYRTVFWSFAYEDWDNNSQPSREEAKKKILENIHNGAILLLHPTSKTNAEILGEVISELKSLGYRFGRLDEIK
jgi:peptidoglycan-N-acetylmuramic acid deacetylase